MNQNINSRINFIEDVFTIPNIFSCFRICLIPLIVWLYCIEHNYLWAGYMLIISGVTDIVDGFIARKYNMTSDVGKILDPIADKLTQVTMLICLLLRFNLMIIPLMLLVIKETFMSITGFLVIRKNGYVMGANWHGKAATCLLYGMMLLHLFWYRIDNTVSILSIIVCTAMIIISFILYAIRNIKAMI